MYEIHRVYWKSRLQGISGEAEWEFQNTHDEHNPRGWLDLNLPKDVGWCAHEAHVHGGLATVGGEQSPRTGDQLGCQRGRASTRLAYENGSRAGPDGAGLPDRVASPTLISRPQGRYWHLGTLNGVKAIGSGNVRVEKGLCSVYKDSLLHYLHTRTFNSL